MIKSIQLEKLLALMIVTGLIFSFAVLAIPTTSADEGVEVLVVFGEDEAVNEAAWNTLNNVFGGALTLVEKNKVKVRIPSHAVKSDILSVNGVVDVE